MPPRKKKPEPDAPVGTILEHMGVTDPKGDEAPGAGDAPEVDAAALQKQIADLNKQVDRLTSSQLSLLSSGLGAAVTPAGGTPTQPDLPTVNLDGLPDQLTDPEGYQKGLNDRLTATIQDTVKVVTANEQAKVSRDKSYDTRVEGLWSDFTEAHPELADHTDLVEFAAGAVAKKAQAKGLNVEQYMFTTRDQFFSDIVSEVDKRFGAVIAQGDGEKDDDTPAVNGAKPAKKDEGTDTRTAGVFGGEMSPGSTLKDNKGEKPGDFIKDLMDVQRASGFF